MPGLRFVTLFQFQKRIQIQTEAELPTLSCDTDCDEYLSYIKMRRLKNRREDKWKRSKLPLNKTSVSPAWTYI